MLDVVITDIRMLKLPKLNGIEAIQFFQKKIPHVSLRVLTGFPNLEMATSFMENAVIAYLVKPVEREKLLAAVSKAMEQREISHF